MANTTIIRKEDINNPIHPNLWEDILESLGVSLDTEEIDVQLSAFDTNKRTED